MNNEISAYYKRLVQSSRLHFTAKILRGSIPPALLKMFHCEVAYARMSHGRIAYLARATYGDLVATDWIEVTFDRYNSEVFTVIGVYPHIIGETETTLSIPLFENEALNG